MSVLHRINWVVPAVLSLLLTACTSAGVASAPTSTSGPPTTSAAPTSVSSQPEPTTTATPAPRVANPGWVTGRVVDDNGRPVSGALVETLVGRDVPEFGLLQDKTPRRGWTKADGSFRIKQASDGYIVRACFPIPGNRRVCKETALGVPYLWSYAGPAGITDSWVTQTALFPATKSDRSVGELRVAPPATVVGRLIGQPFTEVRVMRLNDTVAFRGQTDARGNYVVTGFAAGPYYVAAGGLGTLPWRSSTFTLKRGGTYRVPAARLSPGATLAGTISTSKGVAAFTDLLISKEGEGLVAATTTDDRGRFHVSGFTSGQYWVQVAQSGGTYRPTEHSVQVPVDSGTYDASFRAVPGAVLVLPLRTPLDAEHSPVYDELRDSSGMPVMPGRTDGRSLTYAGIAPGRYTVVAATKDHYAIRNIDVAGSARQVLPALTLRKPTFTLSGMTAPKAVVEATTGSFCPPGVTWRLGSFHMIAKAAPDGSYTITGLVPGTYMLGADGWPGTYAPQCWPDVELTGDTHRDMPLQPGGSVTGRLVYAETGGPVIADLSYELTYPTATTTSPTDEHPARARVQGLNGQFTINRLSAGTVTGAVAIKADLEKITSLKFDVLSPFQDGTPYWLESDTASYGIVSGQPLSLGDIPLTIQPRTP